MARRNTPAGLLSVGFQKITTNSTATTLNTTCSAGRALWLSVETQSVRVTLDGSTPAASTGILLTAANSPYMLEGVKASTLKIARATAGAIVNVQAFKYSGE
jgi:hypothetical protein